MTGTSVLMPGTGTGRVHGLGTAYYRVHCRVLHYCRVLLLPSPLFFTAESSRTCGFTSSAVLPKSTKSVRKVPRSVYLRRTLRTVPGELYVLAVTVSVRAGMSLPVGVEDPCGTCLFVFLPF